MSQTLTKSPLALVLARVQFDAQITQLSGSDSSNIANIDVALLQAGFPAANTQPDSTIQLTAAGPTTIETGTRRVYRDAKGGLHVVVAPEFITLYASRAGDTIAYDGHKAFLKKFEQVLTQLSPFIGDIPVKKVGFRYVDQLSGEDLNHVDELISPSCRGILPADAPEGAQLYASVTRAQFSFKDTEASHHEILQVQSGQIPSGQLVDPGVAPLEEPSWALDIDASSFQTIGFVPADILEVVGALQERAKDFFATVAIKDKFMKHFS